MSKEQFDRLDYPYHVDTGEEHFEDWMDDPEVHQLLADCDACVEGVA